MIQHLERPKKRTAIAVIIMVVGSVALASQAMFVKLASPYLSTNFLTFARTVVNLIMLLLWVCFSKSSPKVSELFKTKDYKNHAIRSLFGVAAIYCFYYSITKLSLATGTLIFYSFPLFVPFVVRFWHRVKFVHRLWWGLGIAFLGLLFVLRPGEHLFNPFSIIPLVGAIIGAVAVVAVRTLNYTEPWERITAYYFIAGVVITTFILFLSPYHEEVYTDLSLGLAFLAGLFAGIFQICLTVAAKFAPMRLISPLVYLSFIFGAIFEYLIWGTEVHPGVILGFFLIVVGTVLLIFLYPKNDLQFHPEKKS